VSPVRTGARKGGVTVRTSRVEPSPVTVKPAHRPASPWSRIESDSVFFLAGSEPGIVASGSPSNGPRFPRRTNFGC
jgi:hypothetical protein